MATSAAGATAGGMVSAGRPESSPVPHSHLTEEPDRGRAFALGVGLNLVVVGMEVVFGLIAGSLALLADAGHNLSDVLGLLLAWGASILARRRPSPRRTYGLRRSTVIAALLN